ncbi:ribulose-phosphate 3-epimerase [Candidatus Margulisiibacteriota bacterium]
MSAIKLAPSILSADFSKLGEEINLVEKAGADWIHVDVMDGHFVPNLTIGPVVVKHIRKATKLPLDVHLMIENPEKYIPAFVEAGADIISIHAEVCNDVYTSLKYIHEHKVKAAIAINPMTPLALIADILPMIDMVLLMTVNPGFGGQAFIKSVVPKIKELKEYLDKEKLKVDIEVDGGINHETAKTVLAAGANILVAGAFIYHAKNPAKIIKDFKKIFKPYETSKKK